MDIDPDSSCRDTPERNALLQESLPQKISVSRLCLRVCARELLGLGEVKALVLH